MASVDNRIVSMEFNNAEFERRVSETMKTLAGLDKAIADVGTKGNGLEGISKAASSFNMDGIGSAIEGISAKFLAMSTIGITALANITNKAVDAGIQLAKSLTIDNIGAGLDEYGLKLNSIQTIMAGSGADLDTVNRKLAELNDFSDKTIYSFADMTQNIGKFTNAGVDLDTSVAAIKGIATAAGLSGANAEEASRAMYNFAQALSKGSVAAIDWKSIELANMGTSEFKQQLIDSGVAMGTLTKQGEDYVTASGSVLNANKGFTESLTDQWLTTETLTSTLGRYADETTEIGARAYAASSDIKTFSQLLDTTKEAVGSGWATSFETIIGNFEEAKGLWGYIGTVRDKFVQGNADARNNMLNTWKEMGGRTEMLLGIKAAFEGLAATLSPIKEAFREVFPRMTGEQLYDLTVKFRAFMEALRPSEKTVENIGRIFKGLFNVLHVGIEVFKFIAGAIKDFIKELTGAGQGKALAFLAEIGDVLANISAEKVIGGLEATFGKLIELLKWPIPYIEQFVDWVSKFVGSLDIKMPASFGEIGKVIQDFFDSISISAPNVSPITNAFNALKDAFAGIGEIIGGALSGIDVGGIIGTVFGTIGASFSGVIDAIAGMFSSGGELENKVKESAGGIDWEVVMGVVGVAMTGGLIATINRLISNGINIDFTGGVLSSISDTFGQLTSTLKTMQQQIKADMLLKIAAAIGVMALSMFALSFIDPEKLVKSAVAIGVAFGELAGAIKILEKIDFDASTAAKFALMALSFALIGGAMVLLAVAVKIFSTMDWEELSKGGVAFAAVVGAIILTSRLIENEAAGMIKASIAMGLMALSMDILYGAVKKFGDMDWAVMAKGFIGVGVGLKLLVGMMKTLPDDLDKKSLGFLGFGIALNILVFAIKQLGQMDLGELVQGGIAFAGMLAILVFALNKMPANMSVTAGQLLALSVGVGIMAVALKIFGSMGWEEMARGLVGMAVSLGILVAAMMLASGGIVGAGAILIMSAALLVLAMAIQAFAAIGFAEFASGMLLIVVALAALAGVALLLNPAIPALLGLGLGLAALGIGFAAIGFGALQVAKALQILSGIEDVGNVIFEALEGVGKALPALFIGVAEGIGLFIETLGKFIPEMIAFGVSLFVALLEGLTQVVPQLLEFVGVVIVGLIDLIVTLIPEFALMGIEILLGILEGIRDTIPQIVTVVGEIITGFLTALAEQIPGIVGAGVTLFASFVTSVAEGLGELMPTMMFGIGIAFVTGFFNGITDQLGKLWELITSIGTTVIDTIKSVFGINSPSTVMKDLGIDLITGFLNGIVETAVAVWDFFSGLAGEVLKFIGNLTRTLFQKGWDLIQGLKNGIDGIIGTVTTFFTTLGSTIFGWVGGMLLTLWDKGWDLIQGLWNGLDSIWNDVVKPFFTGLGDTVVDFIGDALQILYQVGKDIVQGMKNGLSAAWHLVTDWITEKIDALKEKITNPFGIWSPSRFMIDVGGYIMEGLAIGLDNGYDQPVKAMDNMVGALQASLAAGVEELNNVSADLERNLTPTITPVIDLVNIRAGASAITGLLAQNSYVNAGAIASSQQYTSDSVPGGPTEIKFEQTINAPTQLSTADIYRQTRNQITMAKEELSIA